MVKNKNMCKKNNTITNFAIWLAYSIAVLLVVINHEIWFDEAQAWNIARDNDIAGIIHMAKYEGHPILWHMILKPFTIFGFSCNALGFISWGFSVAAAAIIIFAMPIKIYFKAAVLLSSGMLFYNSVISRVYCVIYLLLALITWLYPKRKKHPVVFGTLIALLANTHICMCGMVGIIGIFMLIDYFKDFKQNSHRQNIMNSISLAIAGIGVIIMILMLWGSIGTNLYSAEKNISFTGMISQFVNASSNILESACSSNFPILIGTILGIASQILWFMIVFAFWRRRNAFVMLLFFSFSYFVITEVIWYTTPCRGALYVFSIAMIYIMCRNEKNCAQKSETASDSGSEQGLPNKITQLNFKMHQHVGILFSLLLIISTPIGVKNYFDDMLHEFSPSKATANFISQNIPEDALLISYHDDAVQLLAYLPDRKIYSLKYNRFYTYCSHELSSEDPDIGELKREAEHYKEMYYIGYYDNLSAELVYNNENFIPYDNFGSPIKIYKITADQIKNEVLSKYNTNIQ